MTHLREAFRRWHVHGIETAMLYGSDEEGKPIVECRCGWIFDPDAEADAAVRFHYRECSLSRKLLKIEPDWGGCVDTEPAWKGPFERRWYHYWINCWLPGHGSPIAGTCWDCGRLLK